MGIKNKRKIFTKNDDYFKWYEENKDKVKIITLDTSKGKTKVEYENKEGVKND